MKRGEQQDGNILSRLLLAKGHERAAFVEVLPGLANPQEDLIDGDVVLGQA